MSTRWSQALLLASSAVVGIASVVYVATTPLEDDTESRFERPVRPREAQAPLNTIDDPAPADKPQFRPAGVRPSGKPPVPLQAVPSVRPVEAPAAGSDAVDLVTLEPVARAVFIPATEADVLEARGRTLAERPLSAALLTRPFPVAPARVAYELEAAYGRLKGRIGAADGGAALTPLVFRVLGDGYELFKARVNRPGKAEPFAVNVSGVRRLQLLVHGDQAHESLPVWIEPRLVPLDDDLPRVDQRALLPRPDAETLANLSGELQERHRLEFAAAGKSGADAVKLGRRLLRRSREANIDPALRYTLIHEARRRATEAQDAALALEALDELKRVFEGDAELELVEALTVLAFTVQDPNGLSLVARAALDVATTLFDREDFSAIDTVFDTALSAAGKADNPRLQQAVRRRQSLYREMQQALPLLGQEPRDAAALLAAGRFWCFARGEWERGLSLLLDGADAPLRELAAADLSYPVAPAEQIELADAWQRRAATDPESADRAAYWLRAALPRVNPALQREIITRLREISDRRIASPVSRLLATWPQSLASDDLARSPALGLGEGARRELLPSEPALLTGLQIRLRRRGGIETIGAVAPLWTGRSGPLVRQPAGAGEATQEIRARPGYAVAGLAVKNRGERLEQLTVLFQRVNGWRLDPRDFYWSDGHGHDSDLRRKSVTSDSRPVVGLYQTGDDAVEQIGLIFVR